MQIDLFDTAEFIKINNLREVTDPMLFVKGSIPSPNGLISTDIFGVSMNDRKETFAYIDLKAYFLHPHIYKLLKRINRNFESIVHGSKKFIIENGNLIENDNGETGLNFLYDNWEKLKFESDGGAREIRVNVLKNYKKNELFTRYWIVIPAFYRDVNFEKMDSGKISHRAEINDKYTKLIRLASLIGNDGSFDFVLLSTKAKIQDTLVEIYDFLKGKLSKKEGMIRRNLLGKSVDYASRCVISAPTFHANKPNEMEIDYYHCGVPLAHCCSLFNPFIVAWVRNFFRQTFETSGKIPVKNKKGELELYEADNPELYFNDELIKKEIDNFIKNFRDRFKPVLVPVKSDKTKFVHFYQTAKIYEKGQPTSDSSISNRPVTWCDIFYQAAVDVTNDKCVYITRYPISDYFSIFPNRVFVMSTNETESVLINNTVYTHYPKIDMSMTKDNVSTYFVDTVRLSNLYLAGLGGDYDGDQISIRAVFTQEANAEAIKQMESKSRILTIYSNNIRTTSNEGLQTLYAMTKF